MSRPKRFKPKYETKFEDDSKDKEYFTIIPNYILNHSSVYDRALYIEMKRIAGESGKCWAGLKTLSERTKMSVGQVKNSLDYLLKRRWIKKVGVYNTKTKPTIVYKIVNIWRLNIDFYDSKKTGEACKIRKTHFKKRDISYSEKSFSPEEADKIRGKQENEIKENNEIFHCMKKDISPGDYKEYPYIEEYKSSSLPPPPKTDGIPTERKEKEEDVEKEEKTPVIPPLPVPFDKLKDFELIEAESICKKKGLNLQEQATALSILYQNKPINHPSNLLLKTLRGGGAAGVEGIIKAERARKEKQKRFEEAKKEKEKREAEEREKIQNERISAEEFRELRRTLFPIYQI